MAGFSLTTKPAKLLSFYPGVNIELASYTREGAIWDRQMLEEGPRPTQYKY
jgi:hypothetical protein